MEHVILVIHLLLTLALIGLILLQRSEGGGLGIGGGGGMDNFASAQTTANILTRATQVIGGLFFATSLILAIMASHRGTPTSILDSLDSPPAAEKAVTPDAPKPAPSVPIGQ